MFNRKDFMLILLVILILLLFAGFSLYKRLQSTDELVAVIKQDNKIVKEIYLDNISAGDTIILDGEFQTKIQYKPGKIRFLESGCKDKKCVDAGWLTAKNDTALCLPNRISISLISKKSK